MNFLFGFFSLFIVFPVFSCRNAIIFLIDGLSPQFITPDLKSFGFLQSQGSWTFKARTVIQSDCAAGISSILYASDPIDTGIYSENNRFEREFPSVFDALRNQKTEIKSFLIHNYLWIKENWNYGVENEDFCFGNDLESIFDCDKKNVEKVLEIIEKSEKNEFFQVIILRGLEVAAFTSTFGSENYVKILEKIDKLLIKIIDKIQSKNLINSTFLALISDHGGKNGSYGHWEKINENLNVPLMVMGPGIRKNKNLDNINVHVMDLIPTVFKGMTLQNENLWRGKIIDEIFEE